MLDPCGTGGNRILELSFRLGMNDRDQMMFSRPSNPLRQQIRAEFFGGAADRAVYELHGIRTCLQIVVQPIDQTLLIPREDSTLPGHRSRPDGADGMALRRCDQPSDKEQPRP